MTPVKFGLVGYGAWGKCHADAIRETTGAQLAAIAAKSSETRARAAADFPDAKICESYGELLAQEEIEVVDVVIPSFLHFEVSSAALEAGKHLLLEKPMCLSVADCDQLIQLAEKNNSLLAVGHELRLSSLWGRAKELIDSGTVGQPQYVLVELSRKPYRLGADGWRYDIDRVGNWILEEPIHFFDMARWYLQGVGDPVSVVARANSHQPDHPELQDNFSALVDFPNNAYAVISQSLSMFEHHQTAKIAGTEGSIWASWSGAMDRTRHPTFFLKVSKGNDVEEIQIDKVTGEVFELEDQMAMMVNAIRSGQPLMTTANDGKWSVAMCVAAQKSVETGGPVNMCDVL